MSYFTIERNGRCWENVNNIVDKVNMVSCRIDELKKSTYDEMKSKHWLEGFVMAVMEAANELSETNDDTTIVTLIGEDGCFIWGILMSPDGNNEIRYSLIDWKKDGKSYRYED